MWFWLFIISLIINVLCLLYTRWLLRSLTIINEDMNNLSNILGDFSEHISQIYELEMFYGDETLEGLLKHSKDLVSTIDDLDLLINEQGEEEIEKEYEKKI